MAKSGTVLKSGRTKADAPFSGPITLFPKGGELIHDYGEALAKNMTFTQNVLETSVGVWTKLIFEASDVDLAIFHQNIASPKQSPTQRAENLPRDAVSALNFLWQRLEAVETKLSEITQNNSSNQTSEVRDISNRQAKSEIKTYFTEHHGEILYPDDVAEALNIDVMQAIFVCNQLAKEQKIGKAKS